MTPKTGGGNLSHVPIANKTFRIEDELWHAAREKARLRERSIADVVAEVLESYAENGAPVAPPVRHTPRRSVKVPVATWTRAAKCAAAANETVTDAIRRGLQEFAAVD